MSDTAQAEVLEAGAGPRVILLHSSVAGARQWRALMAALEDRYHLLAVNLYGYGATPPWSGPADQKLEDQARLIAPLLPADGSEVAIIGHSFGGSVAMKAAALFQGRVRRLVLIEPNPFYLLKDHARTEAFAEACHLRDAIAAAGQTGDWITAAEVFANYWTGPGSWAAMPEERRAKFAEAPRPNLHEWAGVMSEVTSLDDWARTLPAQTTVISCADTVRTIAEIVALMRHHVPRWSYVDLDKGGHMAALTRPDQMLPVIEKALE